MVTSVVVTSISVIASVSVVAAIAMVAGPKVRVCAVIQTAFAVVSTESKELSVLFFIIVIVQLQHPSLTFILLHNLRYQN
jgi:hypothetical protein